MDRTDRTLFCRMAASAAVALVVASLASGGCATSVNSGDFGSVMATGSGGADQGTGGAGGQGAASVSSSSKASSGGQGGAASSGSGGNSGGGGAGPECGNGKLEDGEDCDGQDFGAKTCADFGFAAGSLQCNALCAIVLSGCTPAEDCVNQIDDDMDGFIDCADSDCASDPACKDSCPAPTVLIDGAMDFQDTTGKPDTLQGSCTGASGPEWVYEYTASADAQLKLSLTQTAADFSLSVRTSCNDPNQEIACVDDGLAFDPENLLIEVKQGVTYTIIVDGVGATEFGTFQLDLLEVLPESDCTNYSDDDFDNLIDCADPTQCQALAACKPGPGKVGSPCTQHNQCGATGNDPLCIDENFYGWPKGYCSEFCTVATNDCPGGSVCADPSGLGASFDWKNGFGACFKQCAKKADCAAGLMCADFGAGFVCKK